MFKSIALTTTRLSTNRSRDRKEDTAPNQMLNYGYTVLAALCHRSLLIHGHTPALGVKHATRYRSTPLVFDLIKKDEDKQLLNLLMTGTVVGRPFAAPPGTPPGKVENLRRAFDATMKDPEFLAEAQRATMDVNPMRGADMEAFLRGLYAMPKALVDRAAQAIRR